MTLYVEIAISIITVFLVLSLFVTAATEFCATILKTRAKYLKRALKNLLKDDALIKEFHSNALLRGDGVSLVQGPVPLPDAMLHPSYIGAKTFSRSLITALGRLDDAQGDSPDHSLEAIRGSITKITHKPLKEALLVLVAEAERKGTAISDEIEAWYDSLMQRVSGAFKRKQQSFAFCVGLLAAAVFNIDVVGLTSDLKNDELRATYLETAQQFSQNAELRAAFSSEVQDSEVTKDEVLAMWNDLDTVGLGWPVEVVEAGTLKTYFCYIGENWSLLFGWLIAALAATLGAPFWFDILSKFVNLRGVGPKPAPSDETASQTN